MKNNLKDLRDRLGLTQKEISEALGVTNTTYSGYETGYREPRSDFWTKVSDTYGVTIEYLMGRTNEPYKKKELPRELTEEEKKILELFNCIPDDDKPLIMSVIQAALEARGLLQKNEREE